MAEMTLDQQRALALAKARLRLQGESDTTSVNEPTSAANAAAVRNDMYPTITDNYSRTYNPEQSIPGYVANQVGKAVTGLLGIPGAMVESATDKPTPLAPLANLSQVVRQRLGIPSMSRVANILGIEPDMKAPDPMTKAITGAAIDVGQNLLFPGGSTATKVLGGIGSYVGRESMSELGPGGEMVGSVIGGVVLPAAASTRISALNAVRRFGKNSPTELADTIKNNPAVQEKLRQDVVNELTADMRADPATYAAKYAAAQELERAIPGLRLNLGQRFLAPSVIQKQRALEASSPFEMNTAQASRNQNEAALRTALGSNQSARAGAEGAISDLTNQTASRSRTLSSEIAQLFDDATRIASRVQTSDLPALGQKALDIRVSELGKARATANQLMDMASDAAQREGAQFDTTSLVNRARQIQSEPIWDDANYTSIFGKIKALGGQSDAGFDWNPITGGTPRQAGTAQVGFDDIKEMRQAVNADIAAALRSNSPNARAQLRNLVRLKREIDTVIKDSPFENTKQAYGNFVKYYKEEFAPRFLRGVNLLAEKTTSTGEARLPAEKVFSTYLKPNGATEMSRYIKLYEGNQDAMVAMKDAITDRYAREVVKNGAIDNAAHTAFMRKYEAPLNVLDRAGFKFSADLLDTAKSYGAVADRLSALRDAAQSADKDLVRGIISDQFGARTPEQVVGELLQDPRKTNLLLSRMDAKQARGLVEFMKDDIVQQFSKDGQISPDAINQFLGNRTQLQSYKNAIAKVYGQAAADQQVTTLRKIADAAQRLDATPVPAGSAYDGKPKFGQDALYKEVGFSFRTVWSLFRAIVTGRTSTSDAAVVLGGQGFQTVQNNIKTEIYKEMIRDPDSAKLLLQVMQSSPDTGAGRAVIRRFMTQVPSVAGHFIGANKYKELSGYAAGNLGRDMSEDQLQPVE